MVEKEKIYWAENKTAKTVVLLVVLSLAAVIIIYERSYLFTAIMACDANSVKIGLCFANLLVLMWFYPKLTKVFKLRFSDTIVADSTDPKYKTNGEQRYYNLLAILSGAEEDEKKSSGDTSAGQTDPKAKKKTLRPDAPAHYNGRVNRVVSHLTTNIMIYMLFLMIVYPLYMVEHENNLIDNWFKGIGIHGAMKWIPDVLNYLSALFVYLSFLDLYNKTLDKKNRPAYHKNVFFWVAIAVSVIYFVVYILVFEDSLYPKVNQIANRLSLAAGMVNGLAMFLLFSRYISMEYTWRALMTKKDHKLIGFGIVYLLPMYAIVQPLFGTFNIDVFGPAVWFKNMVFLFCLIGKIFFLYVTMLFIRRKVVHLFLHLMITPFRQPIFFQNSFRLRIPPERTNPVQADDDLIII